MGGARPFNGRQGTGGGFVQLEYADLTQDDPHPFLSTVTHELGHAFGLTHSTCYGEDLYTGQSIMSWNGSHHSSGTTESATPGIFLPEEYFLLDKAEVAFPDFQYRAGDHNPISRALVGVDGHCELGAMDGSLGPLARQGYQLYFDGVLVSGPETQYWTMEQAMDNCSWNLANNASQPIRCVYEGVRFGGQGYQLYFDGVLVSSPETQYWTMEQAIDNCSWNLANNASQPIRCLYDGVRFDGNVP